MNYAPRLAAAGTLALNRLITPEILLRQLTEKGVQYTILVPRVLNMIAKLTNVDQLDLSGIRNITIGSVSPSARRRNTALKAFRGSRRASRWPLWICCQPLMWNHHTCGLTPWPESPAASNRSAS